jgi:hypothetical protein
MSGSLVLVVAALVVLALAVRSYLMTDRRSDEMRHVASQLGFVYSGDDTSAVDVVGFELFASGEERGTENLLNGVWDGVPVHVFDFWHSTERWPAGLELTDGRVTFTCAVTTVGAALFPLTIARHGVGSRVVGAVSIDDLSFELGEFNDAFDVRCRERRFAYELIDQRMMRWLLTTDPSFTFEVRGRWLLVYAPRMRPTDLLALLDTLKGFHDHVPRLVGDLYGPEGSG